MLLHANTYLWEYPLDLLPLVLLAIVPARAHPRVGSPPRRTVSRPLAVLAVTPVVAAVRDTMVA